MIVKEEENKREDKRPLLGQAPLTIHFCFLRSLEEKKKINTYTETHVKPRKKKQEKTKKEETKEVLQYGLMLAVSCRHYSILHYFVLVRCLLLRIVQPILSEL